MKLARFTVALAVLQFAVVGCGSSDDEKNNNNPGNDAGQQPDCEFKFSQYAGDCQKLQELPADQGFQLHYGPSNYDDQAEVNRFLLAPHDEKNTCLYMTTPNEQTIYFNEYSGSVRPGSHHMIVFGTKTSDKKDGDIEECLAQPGLQWAFIVGVQNGIGPQGGRIDVPRPGEPLAPENVGVAYPIQPKTRIAFQVHYVNQSDKPMLQESWANFKYKPESEVKEKAAPLWWIGGLTMHVPPGQSYVAKNRCSNQSNEPKRVFTMIGHSHSHTSRFHAYYRKKDAADRTLVYDDYTWSESKMYYYDTVTKNPPPNPDPSQKIGGAFTGQIILQPGDAIEWECDVFNDLTKDLGFGNFAYEAEMCNIFGAAAPGDGKNWGCLGDGDQVMPSF